MKEKLRTEFCIPALVALRPHISGVECHLQAISLGFRTFGQVAVLATKIVHNGWRLRHGEGPVGKHRTGLAWVQRIYTKRDLACYYAAAFTSHVLLERFLNIIISNKK